MARTRKDAVSPRVKKLMARLRDQREAAGLTQALVAERADINASYVGLLERGEREPSLTTLLGLCDAVELSPVDLFSNTAPASRQEPREVTQLRSIIASWSQRQRTSLVRIAKELDKVRAR